MRSCPQARHLFGSYWDDELTQGERDFIESHLADCTDCRRAYEHLARTLEAVGSLPRTEVAGDLADRALAEAKRRQRVPDVIFVPQRSPWQPVAAAAGIAVIAVTAALLLRTPDRGAVAVSEPPIAQPRLVAAQPLAEGAPAGSADAGTTAGAQPRAATDDLFDPAEDIEFILDPVQLRRGRAHTAVLPEGVQGEQAVISF